MATIFPQYRYCERHGVVRTPHNCGRWPNGSNRQWRTTRATVLQQQPICTHPGCNNPSTEVHHISDTHVRAVCHAHNPRGPR